MTTKLSLTTNDIKVLFQAIFDLLNFQRHVMDHCLHSHEQRDRQQNRSNRQNRGNLVKIVVTFHCTRYFRFFSAAIHRSLLLNYEGGYEIGELR